MAERRYKANPPPAQDRMACWSPEAHAAELRFQEQIEKHRREEWTVALPWVAQTFGENVIIDGEPRMVVARVYVRGRRCLVDPLWLMFATAGSA